VEAEPDGILDQLAEPVQGGLVAQFEIGLRGQIPVAGEMHRPRLGIELQRVSAPQLADVAVHRLGAVIGTVIDQVASRRSITIVGRTAGHSSNAPTSLANMVPSAVVA